MNSAGPWCAVVAVVACVVDGAVTVDDDDGDVVDGEVVSAVVESEGWADVVGAAASEGRLFGAHAVSAIAPPAIRNSRRFTAATVSGRYGAEQAGRRR